MRDTLTRRSLIAGSAALAAAVPATTTPAGADPIYSAIERHKAAFRISQVANRIQATTVDTEWHPDYDPVECEKAEKAADSAYDEASTAANALTSIRPITMAGVLALIRYVDAFNGGAFFLEPDFPEGGTADDWRSAPTHWPDTKDEDEIDIFGFLVLANVRSALEAMAVWS
jgi:hypothetical protein